MKQRLQSSCPNKSTHISHLVWLYKLINFYIIAFAYTRSCLQILAHLSIYYTNSFLIILFIHRNLTQWRHDLLVVHYCTCRSDIIRMSVGMKCIFIYFFIWLIGQLIWAYANVPIVCRIRMEFYTLSTTCGTTATSLDAIKTHRFKTYFGVQDSTLVPCPIAWH